ncbi:ROK family protein [Cronobacter sakazakii]
MNVLAIDIGGTKLAAATVDASLRITGRREIPTPASKTPQALSAALETLLSPLKAYADRVAIAATGVIHHGVLTAMNPDNLGGLAHFPLTETVSHLSQVRDALAREPAAFQTPLAAAHYRHDAGLIGAALLAQGENV